MITVITPYDMGLYPVGVEDQGGRLVSKLLSQTQHWWVFGNSPGKYSTVKERQDNVNETYIPWSTRGSTDFQMTSLILTTASVTSDVPGILGFYQLVNGVTNPDAWLVHLKITPFLKRKINYQKPLWLWVPCLFSTVYTYRNGKNASTIHQQFICRTPIPFTSRRY